MNERVDPFAGLGSDLPVFTTKTSHPPAASKEAVKIVAEESGFQSRQPVKRPKAEARKPRVYRTGRNIQFNTKVTQETQDKIYRLADQKNVKIGELLEMAISALEREG